MIMLITQNINSIFISKEGQIIMHGICEARSYNVITTFVTLVKYQIGLLMFKIAKHTIPILISGLYKLNSDVHNYNTRQAHHIQRK